MSICPYRQNFSAVTFEGYKYDRTEKDTQFFACAMFEVGYEDLFHLVLFFIFCYHSRLPFLDMKMVGNLPKSSKSLLQQYFYPAFQYFFVIAHNYVSDRKGNKILLNFLNPSQSSFTIILLLWFGFESRQTQSH